MLLTVAISFIGHVIKKAGRLSQATAAAHAGGVLATIPEAEGGAFYVELDLARPAPPC